MGNFPYASNYLVFQQTGDPAVKLPPWPVRAACAHLAGEYPVSTTWSTAGVLRGVLNVRVDECSARTRPYGAA